MAKNNTALRICANYAKPCPLANRCDNCKNRALKNHIDPITKQRVMITRCRIGNDMNGDTSKCFKCSSEGYRCKAGE